MRLVKLSVNNYKSIRNTKPIGPLKSGNAFIGPNNEGKSSVLEAVHMLQSVASPPPGNDPEWESFMRERFSDKNTSNELRIQAEFVIDETDENKLDLRDQASHICSVVFVFKWGGQLSGEGLQKKYLYPISIVLNLSAGNLQVYGTTIPGVSQDQDFPAGISQRQVRDIIGGFEIGSVENIRGQTVLNYVSETDGVRGTSAGFFHILGSWANQMVFVKSLRGVEPIGEITNYAGTISPATLPALLHRIRNNEPQRFVEFQSMVRTLIPSVNEVSSYIEDGNTTVSIRVANKAVEETVNAYRLDTVGGGVAEIIFLVAAIWFSPPGSKVLIEEPERGLHAATQRALLNAALTHAKETDKQLFWTTHSTVFAPLSEDVSVHIVGFLGAERTEVVFMDREQTDLLRGILGHSNVDLYNYDLLVLWDGESEGAVLPEIIEYLLGARLANSMNFQPMRGDVRSQRVLIANLLNSAILSRTKTFIFADDDARTRETIEDLLRANKESGKFTTEHIHIWGCGIREETSDKRGGEFEDNFSYDELADAANELAEVGGIEAEELRKRSLERPEIAISKILEGYYYEVHKGGWSKVKLNQMLGLRALAKIKSDDPRGKSGKEYEFESAITKLRNILPPG